jgi:predicted permease
LECHLIQHDFVAEKTSDIEKPDDKKPKDPQESEPLQECAPADGRTWAGDEEIASESIPWSELARRGDTWKKIGLEILRNPVLWGIAGGFVLSLSQAGSRFLKPNSDEFIPGLQWFVITCSWFGNCVSPLSLFAMGVWMQDQGRKLFQVPVLSAILFMVSKLILVPFIMVGLAKALDLDDEAGRAAVLIAALPISQASFSLASRYKIGEAILSENVVLGTALVLPTILIWNLVLDEVGLFPIASAQPE